MLLMCDWLLPRASAVRQLHLNFSNSVGRRGYHFFLLPWRWVKVVAIVARAASNLEVLSLELSGGNGWRAGKPVGSDEQAVLAAQSCHRLKCAVRSCARFKELHMRVRQFGGLLLSLLGALPASLERLVIDASDDTPVGTHRPVNLNRAQEGGSHLDLACLGALARLVYVHLHLPCLLLRVPAALSCVTFLHLSCKEMTFSQELAMPDLQHLCLNHHRRDGGSVQLPALHVLTALTALAITGDLVARDWFTLPHLRKCDLTDTTLVAQPPAMCTQLESLCINCQVNCFPVQFAELVGLRSLSMPYMCYTHLPPLITQLSNLETLRLGRVGSVGNLDASALGDLSAFPRLQYLEFRDCYVALAPCVGTHLPAMLQRLFFRGAALCHARRAWRAGSAPAAHGPRAPRRVLHWHKHNNA